MIAVGSDETSGTGGGKVKVYEYSEMARRWQLVETFSTLTDPVHDLAFAPNIGRSYHVLGIAGRDLRIITLRPAGGERETATGAPTKFDIKQVSELDWISP